MKIAFLVFLLFSTVGCQRLGRELFGVKERERTVYVPLKATVIEGQILSDMTRVLLPDAKMELPSYLSVKLMNADNILLSLPYTPVNGIKIAYQQDRAMVIIYNAFSGLPSYNRYRIEYVL